MKEKLHIVVLSLGICTLIGMTFAVSSRDYKEKEPKMNSAPESSTSSKKIECTKSNFNATSSTTKEYNKNVVMMDTILVKIDNLGGDTLHLGDPCDAFKGKARTECNINNVELKGLLRQAKKLEEKMLPYEECLEKLGLLETDKEISGEVNTGEKTKKNEDKTTTKENDTESGKKKEVTGKIKNCGSISEEAFSGVKGTKNEIDNLKCFSDAILQCNSAILNIQNSDGDYNLKVNQKEGQKCSFGVDMTSAGLVCIIPIKSVNDIQKETDNLPFTIMFLMAFNDQSSVNDTDINCIAYGDTNNAVWVEKEWSACSNGKQKRTVECQLLSGKKVEDIKCEGKKPSTYQKCTSENNLSDTSLSKNNLYGPWVASTQSEIVMIGDLVQFTSDRGGEYVYSCGKDGTRSTNPLHPDSEKLGTFYCTYSSVGKKMVTISYQGKVVASKTFIVKEKVEQSMIKTDQKKYKCVDTDGGLDYSKKGSVTGIWDTYVGDVSDPMYTDTHTDMCLNNYGTTNGLPIGLLEHSCNSQGRKTSIDYTCPKGCKDGACIK